jgi:hypothetical protein
MDYKGSDSRAHICNQPKLIDNVGQKWRKELTL